MHDKLYSVAVLPGDGIGPEVVEAALPVFDVIDVKFDFRFGSIGWECWRANGDPIPQETWNIVRETDVTLLGAITSKPERESKEELLPGIDPKLHTYISPVVQLRQKLNLTTNRRPIIDLRNDEYDFVVLRENTEGMYSGIDQFPVSDDLWKVVSGHPNALASGQEGTAVSVRMQTKEALRRLILSGFQLAESRKNVVTIADKPNVLRQSSKLIRSIVEEVSADYPSVQVEFSNVDAVAMWMVTRPSKFDVIIAENMFGDILSDVGGGVMGGLGLAFSGNVGDKYAYFEPVHGSAPHMQGTGRANPMAMFLTIAFMLNYLHEYESADRIYRAVRSVVRKGDILTYDLGGDASTLEVASAIISAVLKGE